jgi:hypothetical protein
MKEMAADNASERFWNGNDNDECARLLELEREQGRRPEVAVVPRYTDVLAHHADTITVSPLIKDRA